MKEIKVYGKAFYGLADDEGAAEKILLELRFVSELFKEHPNYVKILDSPQIDRDDLMKMLNQDFFSRVSRYTLNFLKILCEKRMVHHLDACLGEYEKLYNEDNNIKIVTVTTAKSISGEIVNKLISKLEEKTGGKIILKKRVDESCIGGIIIETDDMKIDSSIKSELENVKAAMMND